MSKFSNNTVTWVRPRYGVYFHEVDGAHPLVIEMNKAANKWHELNAELESEREKSVPPTELYSVQVKWQTPTEFFFVLRCINLHEFDEYKRYWTSSPKPQKNIHSCRYFVKMDGSIVQSLRRGYKVLETPLKPTEEELDRFKVTNEIPKSWLTEWIVERISGNHVTND